MSGVAVCTCVTYNHLHTALAFARAIRRRWRSEPRIFIALVDSADRERPGFDDLAGVEFLSPRSLGVPSLGWQTSKLSPSEMCCMLKPFLVRTLLDAGHETVLYADSDIHFLSDPAPFLDDFGEADFLVTPHLMSPLPFTEPWTRTTMGDLAHAGVLNAGLIGVRDTADARRFLETWGRLCAGPGAFLSDLGGQHEQQFFNWVSAFSDRVRQSRNPRVNVAYWNLHERPIRWGGLDDGGDPEQWLLDGAPIICFHFSGFDWDRRRLSSFDDRSRPYLNANLHALCEYYAAELDRAGRSFYARFPYEFDAVRGVPLESSVRAALKRSEARGVVPREDWPEAGAAALRKLNETLGDASLVPNYLERIAARADLAPFHDHLFPTAWLRWADLGLWRDHALEGQIYERFCPFVFHRAFVDDLTRSIAAACPSIDPSTIRDRLTRDRPWLVDELNARHAPADVVHAVHAASYRLPAFSAAIALRMLYAESAHLQEVFPDVTGRDAGAFAEWLRTSLDSLFECPPALLALAAQLNFERAMARVLSKITRIPHLVEDVRRNGFTRTHLGALVPGAQGGHGFDADDLVLADWWLQAQGPAALRRIQTVIPGDAGDESFAAYLLAWARRRDIVDDSTTSEDAREACAALDASLIGPSGRPSRSPTARYSAVLDRVERALQPASRGVNVFGYFRSPIGLGAATHGLCRALDVAGIPHRDLLIPNDALDPDVSLDDLFQDFAFDYGKNLVVSYPHIEYQLQSVRPRCFFEGRETIGYFAWEQRDFPRAWAARLAPYDRLCALSRFAADAIARGVSRPVDVLPCVVETGPSVAKADARRAFGIAEDAFVVGFVFDAASSIERKNPWALVEAMDKAFDGSRDVVLVLKVGSGNRPDFAPQIAELRRRAASRGRPAIVVTDYMPKREVETLLCALDVYVSLHRSEGFGYTLAEAMLLGVPAMATRYSGNLDFMTSENSFLVDCRETVVRTREGPFETGTLWAEPDVEHAVALLREIRGDYPAALQRARRAVADLADVVSPSAVARSAVRVIESASGSTAHSTHGAAQLLPGRRASRI